RRHTRSDRDWSSDVCSSDLAHPCCFGPSIYKLQITNRLHVRRPTAAPASRLSSHRCSLGGGLHPQAAPILRGGPLCACLPRSAQIGRASCRERGMIAEVCVG